MLVTRVRVWNLSLMLLLLWWPAVAWEPMERPASLAEQAQDHRERGGQYFDQAKWEEAIVAYEKALELAPLDAWTQYRLGYSYSSKAYQEGNPLLLEKAMAAYEQALTLQPEFAEALNELGTAYHALGRFGQAVEAYEKASRLKPEWEVLHFNLADAYGKKGLGDLALAEYRWLLTHPGSFANVLYRVHNGIGQVYERKGQLVEAATAFQTALAGNPDYYQARINLGNVYFQQWRLDEAIAEYKEAIRLQPQTPELDYIVSQMYALQKRNDLAIEWLERTVQKGFPDREAIKHNTLFKRLKKEPKFLQLIGDP